MSLERTFLILYLLKRHAKTNQCSSQSSFHASDKVLPHSYFRGSRTAMTKPPNAGRVVAKGGGRRVGSNRLMGAGFRFSWENIPSIKFTVITSFFFFFFCIEILFLELCKVHIRIQGKVQRFPTCSPSPHRHSLPHYQRPTPEGTSVITHGPTLSHHDHPESTVSIRVRSWWCTFYGFGRTHVDTYP